MNPKKTIHASAFLSLVLRHEPQAASITLDSAGWTDVHELLAGCERARRSITHRQLDHIVATSEKKRFEFSIDRQCIRASQGHSVEVELTPPEILYHGTATLFLDAIQAEGLKRMARHHVHLSAETAAALQVGGRQGKPALLTVRAGDMQRTGAAFFRTANGVWLVDTVPVEFIQFP